jgi:hypothetical protein
MRVTFERLPDHRRGGVLIERDDGVVYRMDGGPVTAEPVAGTAGRRGADPDLAGPPAADDRPAGPA